MGSLADTGVSQTKFLTLHLDLPSRVGKQMCDSFYDARFGSSFKNEDGNSDLKFLNPM